jgi:hypothetical protein
MRGTNQNLLKSNFRMAPRSRATQYEDLLIELRNYIISIVARMRRTREAALLVFQKYNRARIPRLVYRDTLHHLRYFLNPIRAATPDFAYYSNPLNQQEFLEGTRTDLATASNRRWARLRLRLGLYYWNDVWQGGS